MDVTGIPSAFAGRSGYRKPKAARIVAHASDNYIRIVYMLKAHKKRRSSMDIQNEMIKTQIPGLTVVSFSKDQFTSHNFGVLQAGTNRNVQEDTLFHACSISKFITALCVMNLVSERVLDLHRDVNRCLTGWKLQSGGFVTDRPVTLSMLLSHRGGIIDPADSFGTYRTDETPVSTLSILQGETRFHPGPVTVSLQPDSRFEYSDAGFCVIAQIISDVTGKTIPQLAEKYIFDPLGLHSAFFWQKGAENTYPLEKCAAGHDSGGAQLDEVWPCYPNPEGAGLWITAAELAAIVSDFIRCLNGNGRILSKAQAQEMLSGGLGVFPVEDSPFFISQGWGEGMQCKLAGDVKNNRGIVVMMNQEPGVDQSQSIIGSILREFI